MRYPLTKLLTAFLILISNQLFAQIDHWESVVLEGDQWNYIVPDSQLPSNWKEAGFDDSSWSSGPSGFGYGDDDDQTTIETTLSVYLRMEFEILSLAEIEEVLFHIDYDDGFVAYLNGVEISRNLVSGTNPAFDQGSDGLHEATLYIGIAPDGYDVDPGLLNEGTNTLAVEVHNDNINSSDMTAIPFLSVGVNGTGQTYRDVPWWFNPPLEFESSDLPIVVINTEGRTIVDEPKVMASFGIIYNGEGNRNFIEDEFNEYNGFCGIEIRGNSSQYFAKRSYGIETWDANGEDVDAAFLNFPLEEDFVLHGPYADKTLINNALVMELGNQLGQYASRTRFVELVLNDDYEGIYLMLEKIKRDDNRLDIAKLGEDEISGDDLTGGYIFRIDWGDEDGWTSVYNKYQSDEKLRFQYYYPNEDNIQPEQRVYLQNYMNDFEQAMASSTYRNAKGKRYTEYINLRSFVDNFLVNELSKNVDAYRLSTYFYKDKDSKGGKVSAGPLWDFNLAFGNGNYCAGDDVTGWEYYQCPGNSPFWWHEMLQDTVFNNALACRWTSLRQNVLSTESINNIIDDKALEVEEAQERNFQRWPVLGTYLWPNPQYFVDPLTHEEIISVMKNWIGDRAEWMDNNIPGEARHCEIYETFDEIGGVVTGINDKIASFRVYPNPANQEISLSGTKQIEQIRLINQQGQVLLTKRFGAYQVKVSLEGLNHSGLLVVEVKMGDEFKRQLLLVE